MPAEATLHLLGEPILRRGEIRQLLIDGSSLGLLQLPDRVRGLTISEHRLLICLAYLARFSVFERLRGV